MIGKGGSEMDEEDWLSDRHLKRNFSSPSRKEEEKNDDVVVFDFEKDSFDPLGSNEEEEMTCCETCLYEPAKMCTSGKWGSLVAAIFMDLVAVRSLLSKKTHTCTHTHTHSNNRERAMQFLCLRIFLRRI